MTNRLAKLSFGLILVLSLGDGFAEAQSPACETVQGTISRAVCGNPKLQQLTREMRKLLRASSTQGNKQQLVDDQKKWIAERNKTCASKGTDVGPCLERMTVARVQELKAGDQSPTSTQAPAGAPSDPPTRTASLPAANQSCVGARDIVDRATCTDPTLSHWRDLLGTFYQQALNDAAYRSLLVEDQRQWEAERLKRCGAVTSSEVSNCILSAAKRRIEQLVQIIKTRDDPENRDLKIKSILAGNTTPPPGLDADSIDRESSRADQSEQVLNDARLCVRRNANLARNLASNADQTIAFFTEKCFSDFSKRFAALELGPLAASSFKTLVQQELANPK